MKPSGTAVGSRRRTRRPRVVAVAATLAAAGCFAAVAGAGTPNGFPSGPSSLSPTGLAMHSERTEFTYIRSSETVRCVQRAEFSNSGPKRQVELFLDFFDASVYDERHGPPSTTVQVDGRPVPVVCDTIGDSFRIRWSFAAPSRRRFTIDTETAFAWTVDDCADPNHQLRIQTADSTVFAVNGAAREVLFRFEPAASFMAVDTWTDSAVFERGLLRWRWQGASMRTFDVTFDSWLADEHTDLFPGPYSLSMGRELDARYFEILGGNCELAEIDMWESYGDSLTAEMRDWIGQTRDAARSAIESLRSRHRLAPLDTSSSGEPPLAQRGLSDSALAGLNAVERRNLRYAVGVMWALDTTRRPSEIVARVGRVQPPR